MGAKWRYIDPERAQKAQLNRPKSEPGDEIRDIFKVLEGKVLGSGTPSSGVKVPPGWSVRLLEPSNDVIPEWAYEVISMTVQMNGLEVSLLSGGLVALLPPDYRERAHGTE